MLNTVNCLNLLFNHIGNCVHICTFHDTWLSWQFQICTTVAFPLQRDCSTPVVMSHLSMLSRDLLTSYKVHLEFQCYKYLKESGM